MITICLWVSQKIVAYLVVVLRSAQIQEWHLESVTVVALLVRIFTCHFAHILVMCCSSLPAPAASALLAPRMSRNLMHFICRKETTTTTTTEKCVTHEMKSSAGKGKSKKKVCIE